MTERVAAIVGIILMVIAVAVVFFIVPFGIFDAPEIETLDRQCDQKGLRQAEVQRFNGNAVTNDSFHVMIYLGCEENKKVSTGLSVFVVDGILDDHDVRIMWTAPDTLQIAYSAGLDIYQQLEHVTLADSTLNVHITYLERRAE